MGTEFHFCETQGILDTDGSDGCTIMGMYIMSLNCTLKKKKEKEGKRLWSHKMKPGPFRVGRDPQVVQTKERSPGGQPDLAILSP